MTHHRHAHFWQLQRVHNAHAKGQPKMHHQDQDICQTNDNNSCLVFSNVTNSRLQLAISLGMDNLLDQASEDCEVCLNPVGYLGLVYTLDHGDGFFLHGPTRWSNIHGPIS